MKTTILFLFAVSLLAQPPAPLVIQPKYVAPPVLGITLSKTSVPAGNTFKLTWGGTGSAAANLSALQATLVLPQGITMGTATSTRSRLGIVCNSANGICLVSGVSSADVLTNKVIADGSLATIQLTIAKTAPIGSVSLSLKNLFGATIQGLNVQMVAGSPVSFNITKGR